MSPWMLSRGRKEPFVWPAWVEFLLWMSPSDGKGGKPGHSGRWSSVSPQKKGTKDERGVRLRMGWVRYELPSRRSRAGEGAGFELSLLAMSMHREH